MIKSLHKEFKENKKNYLILLTILFFASFLRLYNLSEMTYFEYDQEYAANFAWSVLKVYPVQLIGQGLSIQGLFMGPLYFYYLVPFYYLSHLHPIGGAIGSVVYGLINIIIFYWVGKKLISEEAGLIAAALRAFLFIKVEVDWYVTPAFSSDGIVLLTLFCFYKYWHKDLRYLILLGFLFGLYTSIHPILFPFYLVFILLVIKKKYLPSPKIFILSITTFITPLVPLIIFEYFHQFWEVRNLLHFAGEPTKDITGFQRLYSLLKIIYINPYGEFGVQIISSNSNFMYTFCAIFFLVLIWVILKKYGFWKDNSHKTILIYTTISTITYYYFLPAHFPEYYLIPTTTLILFYTAASLSLLLKKTEGRLFFAILLLGLIYLNLQLLYQKWTNPKLITLAHKDFIVKKIVQKQPKNEDFYVSCICNLGWNTGYKYLFKLYGHEPQTHTPKNVYNIVAPKNLVSDILDIQSGGIGMTFPKHR